MKWCTYQEGWYVLVCTYFLFDHLCHSLDSDSNNSIKFGMWLQYHWYDGHLAILSQMILPRKSVSWCHLRLCSDSFNSCQVPICQTSNSLFGTWLPLCRSTQWCTAWTHGHDASTHWFLEAVIVNVQISNSCYRLMSWAIPLKLFSLVCCVWYDSEMYVKMLLDSNDTRGPFHQHGLTLIPAWISNYMPCRLWDEITHPFLNFSGCTIGV